MRLRVRASLLLVLLAASVIPTVVHAQARAIEPGADYPLEDHSVWVFVRQGLRNQAADLQLARAPESPETVGVLLDAYRPGDALTVLRRIVERRPERMGAAFRAASGRAHQFNDDGRPYPPVVQEIVAKARQRLRQLPLEQAADAAWYLNFIALPVPGQTPIPWPEQLRAFLTEYPGTQAALRAELALLEQNATTPAQLAHVEAFARRHTGTAIGAQALYNAASRVRSFQDSRDADPTERLLRVAALARELHSGAYPDGEWVRLAPGLVINFFATEPRYSKENVARVVAVFREFLVKSFDVSVNALGGGVGYLITEKLPVIFAAGGAEPIAHIDSFLLDLERAVPEPAAVGYVRGLWYRHLADRANDVEMRNEWRQKAEATLLNLARTGSGLYNRKALASLASLAFKQRNCGVALRHYREYVSRFPQSEWTWVAGLRLGQCEQFLGNWAEARQAYESVTSAGVLPPALVLGHTFAGRASEALDDFERARNSYARAERAWDQRFAALYFNTYQFYTRLDGEPCNGCDPRSKDDVSKDWLRMRLTQLRSFSQPGTALLARGRSFATEESWGNAVKSLDEFLRLYPNSPGAAEARELRTRAKLEIALQQAGPDASEESQRAALAALESLATEPYGFSVFASQVARATLQALVTSEAQAAPLMSDALARWHEHGVVLFSRRPTTAFQQDVMNIRDVVFRAPDRPPPFFLATPDIRVVLHDGSNVKVEASSRLAVRPGALLLYEAQIGLLERILTGLGGTRRHPDQTREVPFVQRFWNRFFTMGPGHWGGWILQTFPIVNEVTFIDVARTRGAARIRTGYQGSTQLLTKSDGTWRVTGVTGHWIE